MLQHDITIEELGSSGEVTLEATIEYEIDEGEPMEMPNPRNEAGYPGSPSITMLHKTTVNSYECNGTVIFRDDWTEMLFELLDKFAHNYVEDRHERYDELLL